MDINKCEGCKCDTCSNHCQRCFDCLNSEEPELNAIDLYAPECDSYDA